jgi:two-component system response regulator FlrC
VIAEDRRTRELLELARRVAKTEVTVLLNGESGSGKEVFARFMHQQSSRADGPFVALNCAAIPENMLEAILFGYEKGAFTGAHQANPGKFEQAEGGTLLLDEISEMDLSLQAKLLRVLQEREVERLGGRRTIKLDVRVLATTNRDLKREVAEGRFREDLYYRLNVFPLRLAALRDRPGDILPLAEAMIGRHHNEPRAVPVLGGGARDRLLGHSWPGNVRELDNVVQRALILQQGGVIEAADIMFENVEVGAPGADSPVQSAVGDTDSRLGDDLKQHEARLILDALAAGSRKAAAERLGISPRTLRYKIARLREAGIDIPGD